MGSGDGAGEGGGVKGRDDFLTHISVYNSQVHGLAWSVDDLCLVTCSVEGRVYEWRVHGGKRHAECIIKVDGYVGLALPDSDRCPVYATTATTLREIDGSQVFISFWGRSCLWVSRVQSVKGIPCYHPLYWD